MVENGWQAERKALHGSEDQGDIKCRGPRTIWYNAVEVKGGKQTFNPSRAQLEEWLRQSRVEAHNVNDKTAVLIVVRHNRKIENADVYLQYCDGDGWFTRAHMYLDEFVGDGYTGYLEDDR
jgi:hypothetical protein